MRVFRYQLDITDDQTIELPLSSEVLSVAPGRGGYYIDLWVKVPEEAPGVPYKFVIRGTGHPLPKMITLDFVGTCVMSDTLVWHVFQVKQ